MEAATQRQLENSSDHDLLVRSVTLLDVLTGDLRSLRSDHEKRLRNLERLVYMGLGGLSVIDVLAHTFFHLR